MAKELLKNCVVTIDGYPLNNLANQVSITMDAEMVETTGFTDANRTYVKSFTSWSVTIGFFDDFADNALNEKVFDWALLNTPVPITIKKSNAAVSVTNPQFSGNVWFQNVPLLNAQFGQASGGSITLQGDGTLTRAVA